MIKVSIYQIRWWFMVLLIFSLFLSLLDSLLDLHYLAGQYSLIEIIVEVMYWLGSWFLFLWNNVFVHIVTGKFGMNDINNFFFMIIYSVAFLLGSVYQAIVAIISTPFVFFGTFLERFGYSSTFGFNTCNVTDYSQLADKHTIYQYPCNLHGGDYMTGDLNKVYSNNFAVGSAWLNIDIKSLTIDFGFYLRTYNYVDTNVIQDDKTYMFLAFSFLGGYTTGTSAGKKLLGSISLRFDFLAGVSLKDLLGKTPYYWSLGDTLKGWIDNLAIQFGTWKDIFHKLFINEPL